jgi:hypothetical protein
MLLQLINNTSNVSGTTTFYYCSTNFWYNTPGTSFTNNDFTSYFILNSNVITQTGLI